MLGDVSPRVAALNRVPVAAVLLGVFAAYALLAASSYELFGAMSIGVTFFPPAGLTFACLVLLDRPRWPVVVVAAIAGELIVDLAQGQALDASLGWALANSVEPVVAASVAGALVAEIGLNRRFASAFVAGGLLAGPVVGASIGATVLVLTTDLGWFDGAADIWVGDALGVLVVAPAVVLSMLPSRYFLRPSTRAVAAAVMAFAALGVAFFTVDRTFVGYIAIPMLGWSALTLGARGLAWVSVAMASLATAATAHGHGPWSTIDLGNQHDRLVSQQFFLLMAIGGAWLLALEVRRRVVAVEQSTAARAQLATASVRAELVDELQRLFVPPRTIRNACVDVAGYYRPATSELDIGGDWYELLEHSGGVVDLVVGDVVGHGVRSAATMSRLSSSARVIAPLASGPSDAVRRLDAFTADLPDAQCSTVIWSRYLPSEGRLVSCRAGHPPAIVRTPDGDAHLLDRRAGVPLGLFIGERSDEATDLPPGSLLLRYTDGLIDDRVHRGRDPLCELLAVVRQTTDLHPESLVASIVDAMLGAAPAVDDVAVVCMLIR